MPTTFDPADVTAFEHATWSRCAPTYRQGFAVLTGEAIEPLLDAVDVRSGHRVLDVGTGTGGLAAAARRRGAEVTAVDFSEAMVAEARRGHPDLQVRLASADALPFEDGSFDAVVGNGVLHHLADPDLALREARRVLVDGGRSAWTVWAEPASLAAFGLFFAAVEEHVAAPELPHGPLFGVADPDALAALLRAAGFVDVAVDLLGTSWSMESLDALLTAFEAWAQLDLLPVETQDAIAATVRRNAERHRSGNGFVMPNPMLRLTGATG